MNKIECCFTATLPLHEAVNPRMYKGLTVKTPGCVAFSLPVQRRNLRTPKIPASFRPSTASAARGRQGAAVSSPSGVRSQVTIVFQGTALRGDRTDYWAAGPDMRWPASASAPRRAFSDRQCGDFCRQRVQTGRRLMRQTVLPTMIHGRNAPPRSESCARRFAPPVSRSAGRPGLRFGLPLTPESGGPSRHPAAPYALAIRALRCQEYQNAQQNVDRRHPPGRDPGRCGPRQSSRRI